MKSKRYSRHSNKVTIYHHKLNLENEYNTTYFLITEIEDGKPQRTYYFQIPDSFKDNRLLGEMHERYARYCPN
ncbi:MAG: hypothetical protein ABSF81_16190 [Bacteroidales bacterium]